jgi:glucose-6-phosphate 1-dehydrogenase
LKEINLYFKNNKIKIQLEPEEKIELEIKAKETGIWLEIHFQERNKNCL